MALLYSECRFVSSRAYRIIEYGHLERLTGANRQMVRQHGGVTGQAQPLSQPLNERMTAHEKQSKLNTLLLELSHHIYANDFTKPHLLEHKQYAIFFSSHCYFNSTLSIFS